MDRMQPPPPNYYGVPYPSSASMEQPMMGRAAPNYTGPQPPQPPQPSQVPPQSNVPSQGNPQSDYSNETENTFKSSTNNYIGKRMKVYCSFPDSSKWHDVIFEGRLVYAENDHLVLRSLETNLWTIIVSVYINYIELEEA